jgi:hypothetical protein
LTKPALNRATHFSIVWGVTLAIITLVEWNNVERDPLNHEIVSPFIERQVSVSVEREQLPAEADIPAAIDPESADAVLRYDVSLDFNGPLFLACFFAPVLLFHGLGALWRRSRRGG